VLVNRHCYYFHYATEWSTYLKKGGQGELHNCHEVQQCLMENDVLVWEIKSPIIRLFLPLHRAF
jgi:hypothetical protein